MLCDHLNRLCDQQVNNVSVWRLRVIGEALARACWEPGNDLVTKNGSDLMPRLAAGAQIYAPGRLYRRILAAESETCCLHKIVCRAADVIALTAPTGRRDRRRNDPAPVSRVSEAGSSA